MHVSMEEHIFVTVNGLGVKINMSYIIFERFGDIYFQVKYLYYIRPLLKNNNFLYIF